jgi:hypothetical protein
LINRIIGALGCVFSLLFVGGMKTLAVEGYSLFNDTLGRVNQVQSTMDNLFAGVNNIFVATKTATSGFYKFVPILDDIDNDLQETTKQIDSMSEQLYYMSDNVTLITGLLA